MMIVGGTLGCGEGMQSSTSGSGGQGVSGSTSTSSVGTGGAMSTTSAGTGGAMSSTSTGTGGAMSSTSTGAGGSVSSVRACKRICASVAECATPGAPLNEVDNWACTGGICDYKGCASNQQCTDYYQKPNYICGLLPGNPIKGCFETCAMAAECATPGAPINEVDNWACTGGICDYKGCASNQQCTDYYQKPNYVCD